MSKNQLYKEYQTNGGRLPFKAWLQQNLNMSVHKAVIESEYLNYDGQAGADSVGVDQPLSYKPVLENVTFLGIPKNYLKIGLVCIIAISAYQIYKSKK
jgi:hypothetical protein